MIYALVCEWIFAYYIIETQKDRDIGEITFDHHHENINEPIEKGQVAFRRKEYQLWIYLKVIIGLFLVFDLIFLIDFNIT